MYDLDISLKQINEHFDDEFVSKQKSQENLSEEKFDLSNAASAETKVTSIKIEDVPDANSWVDNYNKHSTNTICE